MTETEEWRFVPGTDDWYQISSLGRFKTHKRKGGAPRSVEGRLVKPYIGGYGYPYVSMRWSNAKEARPTAVHVLIMLAFVGPRPKGQQVCHNDGNALNSVLSNLRYDTCSANQMDRLEHGTDTRGENHASAKLTEADVREIRTLCDAPNRNYTEISRRFNISRGHTRRIHLGEFWGWVA